MKHIIISKKKLKLDYIWVAYLVQVYHTVQHRKCSILDDKIGQLFGYRSTDFVYVSMVSANGGIWIFILFFILFVTR